jgi:hypothetical protein
MFGIELVCSTGQAEPNSIFGAFRGTPIQVVSCSSSSKRVPSSRFPLDHILQPPVAPNEITGFVPLAAYNEGYMMGEGEPERRLALSPAFLRSLGVGAELFEPGLACWYEKNCCCAASRQTASCDRRTRASTR